VTKPAGVRQESGGNPQERCVHALRQLSRHPQERAFRAIFSAGIVQLPASPGEESHEQ
jgi:hypothetical protein